MAKHFSKKYGNKGSSQNKIKEVWWIKRIFVVLTHSLDQIKENLS